MTAVAMRPSKNILGREIKKPGAVSMQQKPVLHTLHLSTVKLGLIPHCAVGLSRRSLGVVLTMLLDARGVPFQSPSTALQAPTIGRRVGLKGRRTTAALTTVEDAQNLIHRPNPLTVMLDFLTGSVAGLLRRRHGVVQTQKTGEDVQSL